MRIAFTLFVFIISPLFLSAQPKWISLKVDDRLTVGFPFNPQKIGNNNYMSADADSSQIYALYTIDLKELGADSTVIDQVKSKPNFASGLGQIAVKSFKLKTAEFTVGSWKGFTSYSTSGTDSRGIVYQLLMLIVNAKFYIFLEGHAPQIKSENAEQFFASIKIE